MQLLISVFRIRIVWVALYILAKIRAIFSVPFLIALLFSFLLIPFILNLIGGNAKNAGDSLTDATDEMKGFFSSFFDW